MNEVPLTPSIQRLATLEEIATFLQAFKTLKSEAGLVFYPRRKNQLGLLALEISARDRERVIDSLLPEDYYKGPQQDGVLTEWNYWEFGKQVNGREVYIKLSLGLEKGAVFCYSFHPAERTILYPYRS